jgi:hypothetical protein
MFALPGDSGSRSGHHITASGDPVPYPQFALAHEHAGARPRSQPVTGTDRPRSRRHHKDRTSDRPSETLDQEVGSIQRFQHPLSALSLWELPVIRALIIATSGRFAADAIGVVVNHNDVGKMTLIELWPDSRLETLLAQRLHNAPSS